MSYQKVRMSQCLQGSFPKDLGTKFKRCLSFLSPLWLQPWVCSDFRGGLLPVSSSVAKRRAERTSMRPVKSPMPTPVSMSRNWSKMGWASGTLWWSIPRLGARRTLWPARRAGIWASVKEKLLPVLESLRRRMRIQYLLLRRYLDLRGLTTTCTTGYTWKWRVTCSKTHRLSWNTSTS